MNYQKLFEYMSREHGVTLLESDMQEIVCIVNDMQKQELTKQAVSGNEVKLFCRLHSMRKNCREYRNNKNSCKTCPHFVEAK
jgi:hypothetical protein